MVAVEMPVLAPVPGFEGFEKRLEVEFFKAGRSTHLGLRALSRPDIDQVLTAAECTIVSQLSNAEFDSYVLSESSLFIYPHRLVIKTCGTTQLLKAIPELFAAASKVGLTEVLRCKYTRGSFLFPAAQPFPHRSFDEEVRILEQHFGCLKNSLAFVMGDGSHKWHVYVAAAKSSPCYKAEAESTFTLEVCMTELDRDIAKKFFKSSTRRSGEDMTRAAGIQSLLPRSKICDFAFDPCGYSMNGLEAGAHSTIHITPEDGFSYASFECMGYDDSSSTDLNGLIDRVVKCFKPGFLSISVHAAQGAAKQLKDTSSSWERPVSLPVGYILDGTTKQDLPGGSVIAYHTFRSAASE